MPPGPLTIQATETGICRVVFGAGQMTGRRKTTQLLNDAATELQEYFAGKRQYFDIPLDVQGTAFQLAVWDAVRRIPFAERATCAQIAQDMGKPDAYRSVGRACAANPCAVLIPDHRIVTAAGHPLGSGDAARIRGALLAWEQRVYA